MTEVGGGQFGGHGCPGRLAPGSVVVAGGQLGGHGIPGMANPGATVVPGGQFGGHGAACPAPVTSPVPEDAGPVENGGAAVGGPFTPASTTSTGSPSRWRMTRFASIRTSWLAPTMSPTL